MPNVNSPKSGRFSGWFRDDLNDRLELYVKGQLVTQFQSSGAGLGRVAVKLASSASLASNGAGAILGPGFIAPASLKLISAWRLNHTAKDVTASTTRTSASYRRMTLITNTAAAGTGTNIVASLNATASADTHATRSFEMAASTVPTGAIILVSHLTVGAETANGTTMAACDIFVEYELV
ncbi:hypothetical protein LCGC14_2710920 [marine sediment metagenome]|uniref:Uncharacterized protein n=1 Tax=marine sediment metagenome TaxID=412755 RepID=A0A0F9A0Q1_9ZZZZ